jgi:hypothetical protein
MPPRVSLNTDLILGVNAPLASELPLSGEEKP